MPYELFVKSRLNKSDLIVCFQNIKATIQIPLAVLLTKLKPFSTLNRNVLQELYIMLILLSLDDSAIMEESYVDLLQSSVKEGLFNVQDWCLFLKT